MIIETKDERLARGHPIGRDVPFAAMGGVTGFSSLMEGYLRLDDSGIGPPSLEELERPVGEDSLESEVLHTSPCTGTLNCVVYCVTGFVEISLQAARG